MKSCRNLLPDRQKLQNGLASSRVMRYDLANHRQLTDLRNHPGKSEYRFFDLVGMSGKRVLVSMGNRLELMTEAGEVLRSYPLEGIGWSILAPSTDEHFAYVGNWFTGQVVKLDLASGELAAATNVAQKCMAGIAVFQ